MYYELGQLIKARDNRIPRDGEFWTAVVVAGAAFWWIGEDLSRADALRERFSDVLTVASILLGFVLAMLTSYLGGAVRWKQSAQAQSIGQKVMDWHVWTVVWVLAWIAATIALWGWNPKNNGPWAYTTAVAAAYSAFVFLGVFIAGQILNHALTLWWVFKRRDDLIE